MQIGRRLGRVVTDRRTAPDEVRALLVPEDPDAGSGRVQTSEEHEVGPLT